MRSATEYVRRHRPVAVLLGLIVLLTAVPAVDIALVLGSDWQGIIPTFTDESFYQARVQTIVKGHLTVGNPYFMEHADGAPLVLFVGTWLNALPQLLGLSMNAAIYLNFIIWSLLFAAILYWLFRELRAPPWVAVGATIALYLQCYAHVWRPVNLQTVYPVLFLFLIAIVYFLREQTRRTTLLLGVVTGASFYTFAYLWQTVVITLGLLSLYALVRRAWPLLRATLGASLIGGIIGLPVPLYALWLSHSSPYFWESVGRLGLVNTHLPMAEVVYSGGWVALVLVLIGYIFWRVPVLRSDTDAIRLGAFISLTGLGLWIMQGSNLFTGKLLETGEHIRLLILHWLIIVTVALAVFLWNKRALLVRDVRIFSACVIGLLCAVSAVSTYERLVPFLPMPSYGAAWQMQQQYAASFAWLDAHEREPVVVWSEPRDYLSNILPVLTKHFTLYTYFGMLELVPEGEIRERYLVSQYFNTLTAADLSSDAEMGLYLGRRDYPHAAKTIERAVKVCRILFFWDPQKDCGVAPTPQSLLGEHFFSDLEEKFQSDIRPNIKAYLNKYHVAYILKDKARNPAYHPEKLGAVRVYEDDYYEIWKL